MIADLHSSICLCSATQPHKWKNGHLFQPNHFKAYVERGVQINLHFSMQNSYGCNSNYKRDKT